MPAPVFYNTRSQAARAIVAFLIQEGAGTVNDTFPLNFRGIKELPNTVVHPAIFKEIEEGCGTYQGQVLVKIRSSASENPGNTANEVARPFFDDRSAKVLAKLRQSDDGQSLQYTADGITDAGRALKTSTDRKVAAVNPDMDQFTCQYWRFVGFGDGEPDGEGAWWEEILIFEIICNSSDTQ